MDEDTRRLARGVGMSFDEARQITQNTDDDDTPYYSHKRRQIPDDDDSREAYFAGTKASSYHLD